MCTIGVSTLDPDSPGTTHDLGDLEDLGYPDEDTDPELDGQDELWPGVGPPVAYQGATGEVLHSKWVTFHEGPPAPIFG